MKKSEQQTINYLVTSAVDSFNARPVQWDYTATQLRACNAKVYTDSNYIWLKSYNTVVAFIDRKTGVAYDVLRLVYGYTATSAQHISKFLHDYDHKKTHRYYPV